METNDYIYIITEEHENSTDCCVHGAWMDFDSAVDKMKDLIEENESSNFNEKSYIDYDEGVAQSDPEYNSESYTDFKVEKLPILEWEGEINGN